MINECCVALEFAGDRMIQLATVGAQTEIYFCGLRYICVSVNFMDCAKSWLKNFTWSCLFQSRMNATYNFRTHTTTSADSKQFSWTSFMKGTLSISLTSNVCEPGLAQYCALCPGLVMVNGNLIKYLVWNFFLIWSHYIALRWDTISRSWWLLAKIIYSFYHSSHQYSGHFLSFCWSIACHLDLFLYCIFLDGRHLDILSQSKCSSFKKMRSKIL